MAKLPKIKETTIPKWEAHGYAHAMVDLLWADIVKLFAQWSTTELQREEAYRAARVLLCTTTKSWYMYDKQHNYSGMYSWRGAIAYTVYERRLFCYERKHGKKFPNVKDCPPCPHQVHVGEGEV